ncbi:hypothetical protein PSN45_005145 [Yamadazyma tenuis]|uniref:C2H2-type domain-containing protein n=1 Tax=Candida tenuis (strain ATCC 10573 / BCRC 21748 / CBS 615 / JCM 9827 / NBRC 10315 / NRRL Y-1498 / VKM Y-70) TaxID=590646 RepID=G3B0T0_CANTC|nr:uncharacterized protein CANTEDRAFT_134106 [Yamadazyma tenuis ATCC 10573]EGV64793.1 hypothetical protein CANTEDRAFT_134106 [Yamadazyma tenuis ATCC 10573]WEJ97589.1 hypothetical protein PSN45_005145 [Yamadazyma tenuis]
MTEQMAQSKSEEKSRPFACAKCNKSFTRAENLMRHRKSHLHQKYTCPECHKVYSRSDSLNLHTRKVHNFTSKPVPDVAIKSEKSPLVDIDSDRVLKYLLSYWKNFHPSFAILHCSSYSLPTDYPEDLLANVICAIGARYMENERYVSNQIFNYVFQKLDQFPKSPSLSEVQAILLASFTGIYSGGDSWFTKSFSSHSRLVNLAREMSIFQYNPLDNSDSDWMSFIETESNKRIAYGLYLVDALMAILLNYPPCLSHYEIKHTLPCPDEVWEAETAQEWLKLSSRLPAQRGPHFFEALQQVLMFGHISSPISSFGGLASLLAIHIMIRNMAQYAGILETSPVHSQDAFSRRSQLGSALNGLRTLIPKRNQTGKLSDMWDLFTVTWNLAYIHLHLPDTIITSGIVEVSLDETIATASALAKPQSKPPPGTALLSNDFTDIPYQVLSLTSSHVFYFLYTFTTELNETSPVFTFMFYKAALVAWQILNAFKSINQKSNEEILDQTVSQLTKSKTSEKVYMLKRLTDDMINCIQPENDHPVVFEKWVESVLASKDTWGVGSCGAASFASMIDDPL